jgi:hypothetical protein
MPRLRPNNAFDEGLPKRFARADARRTGPREEKNPYSLLDGQTSDNNDRRWTLDNKNLDLSRNETTNTDSNPFLSDEDIIDWSDTPWSSPSNDYMERPQKSSEVKSEQSSRMPPRLPQTEDESLAELSTVTSRFGRLTMDNLKADILEESSKSYAFICPTISKDNTLGEQARQSELLASY